MIFAVYCKECYVWAFVVLRAVLPKYITKESVVLGASEHIHNLVTLGFSVFLAFVNLFFVLPQLSLPDLYSVI